MRLNILIKMILLGLLVVSPVLADQSSHAEKETGTEQVVSQETDAHHDSGHSALPPMWLVAPFLLLLILIATGPLFFPHLWEHHYPKIAMSLGTIVALYYGFAMDHGVYSLLHTLEEYISFIALLTALFVASGGILIKFNTTGKPLANAAILLGGALLSNLIGTTGASMLLIRPFMRLNEGRLKPFHVIFFIFVVSNIGGGLTPIGDPPLFLGFLKGVPFFWVISNIWHIWLVTVLAVVGVFVVFDMRVPSGAPATGQGKVVEFVGRKTLFISVWSLYLSLWTQL